MQFVAIDLETTWLSPETDTIIEVAAIYFELERVGDTWQATNTIEKTMLINPGIPLSEEVSIITGISDDMLVDKPTFDSVRDRVRDFIGDRVIVGHNVLFDIAMFTSHGIDLSGNTVIDTFELSEILSQDVASLNLGFLCRHYGIQAAGVEHRALTDTWLSIGLLTHYIDRFAHATDREHAIIEHFRTRDPSGIVPLIHALSFGDASTSITDMLDTLTGPVRDIRESKSKKIHTSNTSATSINGPIGEEITIIKKYLTEEKYLTLIGIGTAPINALQSALSDTWISTLIMKPRDAWLSPTALREAIGAETIPDRKMLIFLMKLCFWILHTETGLIDELKYYGPEYTYLDALRTRSDEDHLFVQQYHAARDTALVLIYDLALWRLEDISTDRYRITKDIPLLEERIRRTESVHISFSRLIEMIESFHRVDETSIHLIDAIEMIESIYTSTPDRPTWPTEFPPGKFGETYFVTQSALWHRGHKWLIHASRQMLHFFALWQEGIRELDSRKDIHYREEIERQIMALRQYHFVWDDNTGTIIHITENDTEITLIPRMVAPYIKKHLQSGAVYGYRLDEPMILDFVTRECGLDMVLGEGAHHERVLMVREYHPQHIRPGTVILTTSLKHIREIGQELKKYHPDLTIIMQWLSWGKAKMQSTFVDHVSTTVLVGLIDTWRDAIMLWKHAEHIIIAKMPFDPPTDPYFLARTVSMKNTFSAYSEPMVLIRINTLIGRILSSGYAGEILATDPRIMTTEWGKSIRNGVL